LIYLFTILFIGSGSLCAQSSGSQAEPKVPKLNGHMFLSSSYLRSSFISTSVQADLGFGITSTINMPGIDIGEYNILAFKGQLMFFDVDAYYQQRFTPWLAMFVSLKMAGRVGTDMSTIVTDGVNTLSGGDIGWLIRITQTDRLNLSGAITISSITGNFINVRGYFEELINNEPYPTITKTVPSMIASLGLKGAYAFNPSYGLQFNLAYGYGESLERGNSQGYFAMGVLGDLDFNPRRQVPIGLGLGYTLSSAPAIVMYDGGTANLFMGKISYTGSDDFQLGLQFTFYSVTLSRMDDNASVSKVMLNFKFYF
ncbi:MAG: hypothetical protein KAI08_01185, partial [Bacteroidales bacterium]|nr:hypothetical protein [Bacteroidales bacterium]